jgi:hypothetical protein
MMKKDPEASVRREEQSARLDAFVRRTIDEGHLRPGTDAAWARAVLDGLVDTVAHQFPAMEPPRAADLVAGTFLTGLGAI